MSTAPDPFASILQRAKAIAAKLTSKIPQKQGYEQDQDPRLASSERTQDEYQPKENEVPTKTIEIVIPSHMASLVIGRAGETLRQIETHCRVRIQLGEGKSDGERIAIITGEESQVKEAKSKIEDIVHGSGSLAILFGGNQGHETVYVQVPAQRVGLVIGRGGETIKALQERSGAKINVVKDNESDPHSSDRTVVVNGPPSCIAHARQLIHELVSGGAFTGQFGGIGGSSETIMVPKDKIGLIIGKGGETIKAIQKDCNVKLNIDANSDRNGERPVTISGTAEAIAMAKEQVLDRVAGNRRHGQDLDYEFTYTNYSDPTYAAYAPTDSSGVPYDPNSQPAYDPNQQYDASAYQNYDPKAYAEYISQYYASQGYPGYTFDGQNVVPPGTGDGTDPGQGYTQNQQPGQSPGYQDQQLQGQGYDEQPGHGYDQQQPVQGYDQQQTVQGYDQLPLQGYDSNQYPPQQKIQSEQISAHGNNYHDKRINDAYENPHRRERSQRDYDDRKRDHDDRKRDRGDFDRRDDRSDRIDHRGERTSGTGGHHNDRRDRRDERRAEDRYESRYNKDRHEKRHERNRSGGYN